jgi:hypothetical protein
MPRPTTSLKDNPPLPNGTTLAACMRAPALARGVIMRHLSGVLPSVVVLTAVVTAPVTATAQERASLEGFGGLSINGLPSAAAPVPSLGGAVTFSIVPGIDIIGEAGRLGNVLPPMSSAAFSVAQTGLHASAFYGEAGARFVMAPTSIFTPYAEATAGIARLQLRSDQLGSVANAAMSMAVGLVEGATPTLGAGGGILLRGGPMLFDIGYRYKQLFE